MSKRKDWISFPETKGETNTVEDKERQTYTDRDKHRQRLSDRRQKK